jgi:hypothetical protein
MLCRYITYRTYPEDKGIDQSNNQPHRKNANTNVGTYDEIFVHKEIISQSLSDFPIFGYKKIRRFVLRMINQNLHHCTALQMCARGFYLLGLVI